MEAVLEVRNVRKRFGAVEALRGISFTLKRGEVLGIAGDNGAGKSTLIKVISGVHIPDEGEIELEGHRVIFRSPREARNAGIETIYQDLALADQLNVGANIFLGREPTRKILGFLPIIHNEKIRQEVNQLLGKIESHIPDYETKVMDLSGGQRQAVAIARAMYWKAKIVIMDEPTAALAAMESKNVVKMARSLASEGISVIFIDHNLPELLEVCDRVMVMYRGRKVYECPSRQTSQDELVRYMTGYSELAAEGGERQL
jgi:simple sugar transport system ATP-binding protein